MRRIGSVVRCRPVALGILALVLISHPVQAELYVAGQVGGVFPGVLSDVDWSVGAASASGSDLDLDNSVLYGGKVGYFFPQLPLLGVELDVYNAHPDIARQLVRVGGTPIGTIPSIDHRMLTFSPIGMVFRVPQGKLEPYVGVGLGLFFSHIDNPAVSSSDMAVGFTAHAGLRYRVTSHVAVFGEWKFNWANVEHTNLAGTGLNFDGAYRANIVAFGVGYHF